jgi:hypothetical protein
MGVGAARGGDRGGTNEGATGEERGEGWWTSWVKR